MMMMIIKIIITLFCFSGVRTVLLFAYLVIIAGSLMLKVSVVYCR